MRNLGVNDGHTISGIGSGARGIINESEHTRLVGNEVRKLIKDRGHKAINCTIDYAKTTNESLELIIQQANRQDLDWFISIHFNAGGGQGVEVYTYEGRQYQDALNVCSNISALGFRNRGVKSGTGLYVIRRTKAKSMLIEVCFVDTDDANKYLKIGHKAIAKAIVDGILGKVENNDNNEEDFDMCVFSEKFYRENNKDVNDAIKKGIFKTGYEHYVKHGRKEGRSALPPIPKEFCEGDYLELNRDVAKALNSEMNSGLAHYLQWGWAEKRRVNKNDTDEVLRNRIKQLEKEKLKGDLAKEKLNKIKDVLK